MLGFAGGQLVGAAGGVSDTAVFVSLLWRACACGSSTILVLFYGQPADSAMRVSVVAASPHGAARKGEDGQEEQDVVVRRATERRE